MHMKKKCTEVKRYNVNFNQSQNISRKMRWKARSRTHA